MILKKDDDMKRAKEIAIIGSIKKDQIDYLRFVDNAGGTSCAFPYHSMLLKELVEWDLLIYIQMDHAHRYCITENGRKILARCEGLGALGIV